MAIESGDAGSGSFEPRVILASVGDAPEFADPGSVFGGSSSGGSGGDGGSDGGSDDGFNPDLHVGRDSLNGDGSFRRKRGGGKRGGNSGDRAAKRPRVHKVDEKASGYALALFGMFGMVASATSHEHWTLTTDEAQNLGKAAATLEQFYPIGIKPEHAAIAAFGMAFGTAIFPRIYLSAKELQAKKPKKVSEETPAAFSAFPFGNAA